MKSWQRHAGIFLLAVAAVVIQQVNYMGAAEYNVWFKQAYEQFGALYKTLGIETK